MKVRKVAFFVNSLDSGGIENYLLRFLNHFREDLSLKPVVFCKSGRGGGLYQEYHKTGIKIVYLKLGAFNPCPYFQLVGVLKKYKFDSVVDFTGNFGGFTVLAAYSANIPKRIIFYRGASNHFQKSFFKLIYNNLLNRIVYLFATDILSNSKAALNYFFNNKWKSNSRFSIIYNGIDSSSFLSTDQGLRGQLNISESDFIVGHVGRFTEAKNHKTIIEVAIKFCSIFNNVHFILCGKDVDVNCEQIINDNNLQNRVHLFGNREDIIKILNTLDCFYFPSLTEGQPNALIEALIRGLPFVASNIEPIKETIPHEFHDYLVDPNSVEDAVSKLTEVYHSKIRVNLSEWSIKNYDANKLFTEFYNKL